MARTKVDEVVTEASVVATTATEEDGGVLGVEGVTDTADDEGLHTALVCTGVCILRVSSLPASVYLIDTLANGKA
jgi:hypothetical protein